jgi:mRNA-degrading endonuclease toxin of MazEF toxin-antitoxin module
MPSSWVVLPADLAVSGAALSDQIKSVDWRARNARLIGTLPDAVAGGDAMARAAQGG